MTLQATINDYLEFMDHEFTNTDIAPNKKGYKVDRNGIKNRCEYANLKSVDYFHESNERLHLVEFSDLARQHLNILTKIDEFKKCNLCKEEIKRNVKRLHREIGNELKIKYLDSLRIISKIPKVFSDPPEWIRTEAGKLVVVVAPIDASIDESKKEDIARVLEKLKDDLACSIPDDMFVGVQVVQVDSFFN